MGVEVGLETQEPQTGAVVALVDIEQAQHLVLPQEQNTQLQLVREGQATPLDLILNFHLLLQQVAVEEPQIVAQPQLEVQVGVEILEAGQMLLLVRQEILQALLRHKETLVVPATMWPQQEAGVGALVHLALLVDQAQETVAMEAHRQFLALA